MLSTDKPESFRPTGTENGPTPEPISGDVCLRQQVMEVISDVLADPCPERGWARHQLRELLAAYPDEPERALREHLIITREQTGTSRNWDRPGP